MTPSDREPTGQRIARARRRRTLSQAVLAGLVGRSESWLSQVERGKRGVDSHSVLVRLAEILRVDIEELTGSADRDETGRRAHPAASLIEQAMMGYGAPGPLDGGEEEEREVSLDFLRAQAHSAYQAYQATRYDAAGRILPGLIRGVEAAARTAGSASPAASAVRARVYDTTAALLSRVGEPFLAWAAADRAMFAAEQSGDPLLVAASAWRMSYMITGRKHAQEALELAMAAETGEALDLAAMPVGLVGRRTQVNLDLARAYAMTRKDAAAVNLLLAAERLSPQLVAMTRRPEMSSPSCCAASTARRRQSCRPSRAARA
jgi:transcriptional regulator with XRE-family HTH domain